MFTRTTLTAVALALGLAGAPLLAHAETTKVVSVQKEDVKAELIKLKKAVGSGEISQKEYKARKEALEMGTQLAKADGK